MHSHTKRCIYSHIKCQKLNNFAYLINSSNEKVKKRRKVGGKNEHKPTQGRWIEEAPGYSSSQNCFLVDQSKECLIEPYPSSNAADSSYTSKTKADYSCAYDQKLKRTRKDLLISPGMQYFVRINFWLKSTKVSTSEYLKSCSHLHHTTNPSSKLNGCLHFNEIFER